MKSMLKNLLRPLYRKGKAIAKRAIKYTKYVFSQFFCRVPKQSDIPIEVCLVTVQKDFATLKLCLEGIRKFVKHPITKISVVSKVNAEIKEFCEKNDCIFVDELSILGYGIEKFQDIEEANLKGREGWLFQQLLKLGFDKICEQEHYLVVDTDTIFLKPRIFKFSNTTIFEYGDEWHIPYQNAYKKLMGFSYSSKKSFVVHCMFFEKSILRELKNFIENKHKISWDNAIIKTADYSSKSFFSEYETYGHFFLHFHRNNMRIVYWFNYSDSNFARTKHPFWAKSFSSHTYLRPQIEPSMQCLYKISKIVNILLGEGMKNIFEFGSRYGEDTCEFAKKYPEAIVYAFECNPEVLPICRKAVSEFSNIVLTERAVSDEIGTVTFYPIDKEKTVTTWADGNQGASSLFKSSGKYKIEQYVQKEITVESTTLNAFVSEYGISSIDLLWMDVQGAELKVLKGLGKKLNIVKVMNIEVEFMEIYKGQPLFDEIRKFLESNAFEFLEFSSKGKYSGDAIFVNSEILNSLNKNEIRKLRKISNENLT
jgi:FkbM family methyltransferase